MEGAAPSPLPQHIPFARSLARQRFPHPSSQSIVLLLNYTIRMNLYKTSWRGFAPRMVLELSTSPVLTVYFATFLLNIAMRLPVPPQKVFTLIPLSGQDRQNAKLSDLCAYSHGSYSEAYSALPDTGFPRPSSYRQFIKVPVL